MDIIRKCDFCDKQAIIFGKTKLGPEAYMCPDHLSIYGYPASLLNTKLAKCYLSQRYNKGGE